MKRKILVLEDEENIRSFLVLNLKRSGYEVIEAETGEMALEKYHENQDIAVAVLDVMLPGIDGYEVCRAMRGAGYQAGVIMLTARTQEADKIEGFYCTDFWCYPMFRDICEWMKKPVAVGTMGLLIQKDHPALASFPAHKYSTPQWYKIVSHCDCAILDDVTDKSYRPCRWSTTLNVTTNWVSCLKVKLARVP